MSTPHIPQLYPNIIEFFNVHKITMKWKHYWRLTPVQVGHFRACPSSHGLLVATNGILAFTESAGGHRDLFLGHLDNFIPDEPDEVEQEPALRPGRKAKAIDPLLLELVC